MAKGRGVGVGGGVGVEVGVGAIGGVAAVAGLARVGVGVAAGSCDVLETDERGVTVWTTALEGDELESAVPSS
jgi:hypothetical protein